MSEMLQNVGAIMFRTGSQSEKSEHNDEVVPNYDYCHQIPMDHWYIIARRLRRDATVALARGILTAPIIKNAWRVEGESEKECELVKKVLFPHRQQILKHAIFAGCDYGWMSWEIIPKRYEGVKETHFAIKPMRHELTRIRVDNNGFPSGLNSYVPKNGNRWNGEPVKIGRNNFVLCAASDEYDNPYGDALLRNTYQSVKAYENVESGVSQFIDKVAGAYRLLWFPVGSSLYNGRQTDNSVIANSIISSMEYSKVAAFPVTPDELNGMMQGNASATDARKSAWRLEILESRSGLDPFIDRQKYLDSLKMRSLLLPERVALEGQNGTKAESMAQADIALISIEQWGENIINWFNSEYGFVARILQYNGIEWYPGRVTVHPLPLSDDDKAYMREIFRTIVNNLADYSAVIDIEALGQRANIPVLQENLEKLLSKGGISNDREDKEGDGSGDGKPKEQSGNDQDGSSQGS